MISAEKIQSIRNKVRIADVVGEFVALKPRGDNLVACCPFHSEKDPTFVVQPEKNIFYCFGCHRGGDAVSFLMEREHCSEEEALRWLAKRYDVAVPEDAKGDALYRVSEFAQRFFEEVIHEDEMGRAVGLSYLHGRGLTDDIIHSFGLGYCPDEWTMLTDKALKEGFEEAVLVQTGLTVRRDDGRLYDRFKGRVTFPIYSVSGRVIGFSCRILRNDKEIAKYVNSPESPIYDKGGILYGLYQAKQAIKEQDKCFLVEGNVDVVSMHQCGVVNTVASCGTALTDKQVRLIKQFTQYVTVVYDGDKAGVKATMRAAELLFKEGMKVRMVLFPDDDDPDSYARKYGKEQLHAYLKENEVDYVDYSALILDKELRNDPIRKAEALKALVKTIACVGDRIERDDYLRKCAQQFRANEQSLRAELAKVLADNAQKEQMAPMDDPTMMPPPDEYFDEQEAIAPPPQRPILPASLPDEAQERQLIALLLNEGSKTILLPAEADGNDTEATENQNNQRGEEPRPTEEPYYVATVIVGDLSDSELEFDNPIYEVIYQEYKSFIERGELPSPDYFIHYPEEQLRNTAIALMVNTLHVSPKWTEKHVSVHDPAMHLKEDVIYSLLTFKLRKLDRQVEQMDREIRLEKEVDDMLILVEKKRRLLVMRKNIADQLNCVYN